VKEGGGEEGERERECAREVIRNADALAVTSPTLLFRSMQNAAHLNRNALSDRFCCGGSGTREEPGT
jgi:hypothetical protein